ncbi:MAG: hypothetical protein ABW101_12395 [Candidatus Thiodiazotropha sp.]
MDILPKKIHETLIAKGVTHIYYANNVSTACRLLRHRCLMSQVNIDRLGIHSSSPGMDSSAEHYTRWNDVFTDTVDIHQHTGGINPAGPVVLELDIEIIRNTYTGKVWVTRSNPAEWGPQTHQERKWFSSAVDLEHYFSPASSDHLAVFRHCGGKLPIQGYLKRILLDDPGLEIRTQGVDCFSMAYGALKLAMSDGGFNVPIVRRDCEAQRASGEEYDADEDTLMARFSP